MCACGQLVGIAENVIKKLHQVLKPFMLRRIKSDVEKDLPPKKELKLFIGMTDMQKEVYKKYVHWNLQNHDLPAL